MLLGFTIFSSYFGFLITDVYAWTALEGHISEDTALTLDSSPYRVVKDVIVDSGVKLTIEPGVKVEFADGYSLIVEGSLSAIGTEISPIIFTSSRVDPSPGAWNTIKFIGAESEYLTAKFCHIQYARNGLTLESNTRVVIEKSRITSNSVSGIFIAGEGKILLEENTIDLNTFGVTNAEAWLLFGGQLKLSDIELINNSISSNSQIGVLLSLGGTGQDTHVNNLFFFGNRISSNHDGIKLLSNYRISNIHFSHNVITSNEEYGVRLDSDYVSNVTLNNNQISSNGYDGVHLSLQFASRGGGISDVTLCYNNISSNRDGIYIYGHEYESSNFTLNNNVLFSNDVGICMHACNNSSVFGNTISSNEEQGILIQYCSGISIVENRIERSEKGIYAVSWGEGRSNIESNTITNNVYGIHYHRSWHGNLAKHNDICFNTYGMNVTEGANVNAEHNYWGDPSGPYHPSLNPEGKGNPVNGDGTDLDFIPYAASPFGWVPPIELEITNLSVEPARAEIGESVAVSVDVRNIGEEQRTCEVSLSIDGVTQQYKEVTLDKGASATLTFTLDTKEIGIHTIEINGASGTFEVIKKSIAISCSVPSDRILEGNPVTVSVVTQPSLPNEHIYLIHKTPSGASHSATKTTDKDGIYSGSFTPTEIGTWTVEASWPGNATHSEAISELVSFVVVEKGGLKVIVKDQDDNAIAGASVSSTDQPIGQPTLSATSGSDGSVSFTDIMVGDYILRASKGGYQENTESGSVSAGETAEVPITLAKRACLIATATYGSELSPQVQFLRRFRDNNVLHTFAGSNFMTVFDAFYYSFSPFIASVISANEFLRGMMKVILYPLIIALHISSAVYSVFSFNAELGVLMAGLTASSLIGIIYLLPAASLFSFKCRFARAIHSKKAIGIAALVWIGSVAAIVSAEVASSSLLMMVSTGMFVLATIYSVVSVFIEAIEKVVVTDSTS